MAPRVNLDACTCVTSPCPCGGAGLFKIRQTPAEALSKVFGRIIAAPRDILDKVFTPIFGPRPGQIRNLPKTDGLFQTPEESLLKKVVLAPGRILKSAVGVTVGSVVVIGIVAVIVLVLADRLLKRVSP